MIKEVSIRRLEIGVEIARDVVDASTGNILIPQESILTDSMIEKLERHGISSVFIHEKESDVAAAKENKKIAESYVKIEERLFSAFDDVASGKDVPLDKIDSEFQKFSTSIAEEPDIITQLQLLKNSDDYTFNHSMGVSVLAVKLGYWMGCSEEERIKLSIAGAYHDIGKMKVDQAIVQKQGRLTDEEFTEMKRHAEYSYEIVKKNSGYDNDILMAIRHHHEKMDGSGYPDGIKGNEISKLARIMTVCDIYHALTSNRVYRKKDSPFKVAAYLRQDSFGKLDPEITHVFLDNIAKFYVGNKVLLSDGRTGIIVFIDPIQKFLPMVQVGNEFIDFKREKQLQILDIVL